MFKLVFAAFAIALMAAPSAVQAAPPERSDNIVQVRGEGEAEAPPDGFTLNVSLRERASERAEALETLATKLNRVRAGMAGMEGLETVQVVAGGAEVGEVLPRNCENYYRNDEAETPARCEPIAYSVTMEIEIKSRPAKRAGDALSLLSEFDVASVSFDQFWMDEDSDLTRKARRKAIQNALASARDLADAAGLKLGEVKLITTQRAATLARDTITVAGSRVMAPPPPQFRTPTPPAPKTSLNVDPKPIEISETVVLEVALVAR